MRSVARIAQSVEQGIENPRVLGSIPSPGTTYSENPAYGWVFAFQRRNISYNLSVLTKILFPENIHTILVNTSINFLYKYISNDLQTACTKNK